MKIYTDHKDISNYLKEFSSIIHGLELTDSLSGAQLIISDNIKLNPTIYISNNTDLDNLTLIQREEIFHVIGLGKNLKSELKTTLDKIISKELGSIEKYLNENTTITSRVFNHSKEISALIEEMISSIDYSDYFDSPKDYLRLILNELITNSFFHQMDLEDKNRRNSTFDISNSIQAKLAMDSEKIIVSVRDSIGTVTPNQLTSSLIRGIQEKTPIKGSEGAGLGLYMVYENTNQFIINKKEQEYSEFICIIDANKRFKKFKERVTSFHFFVEEIKWVKNSI